MIIARGSGIGANAVEPVVVVFVDPPAEITAILRIDCLVGVTHSGVNVCNGDALAFVSQSPDIIRIDMRQVGFDGKQMLGHRFAFGFDDPHHTAGFQRLDFRESHQSVEDLAGG